MKEKFEKNKKKENQFINVKNNELIGINYYEDELFREFNIKRNNPESEVPSRAIPRFIDINVSDRVDDNTNYLYNPILNVKNDNDIFELTELILKESGNNIPGCKMLLNTLIFFVVNFRPESDRNFEAIMKLLRMVYSPNKHNEQEMGFDYLMNKLVEKNSDSMTYVLYSGFKVLEEHERLKIAVLLYETLMPFHLNKYKNFNAPVSSCISLKPNEFPCYMLYLDDYENSVQDRILAKAFAIQNKNVNIV